MSNHIENIQKLLTQLDNTFYDTIDSGLIQHPDLCTFAFNMENIITNIKHSLEQLQLHTLSVQSSTLSNTTLPTNIDYSQLQALSTQDR